MLKVIVPWRNPGIILSVIGISQMETETAEIIRDVENREEKTQLIVNNK